MPIIDPARFAPKPEDDSGVPMPPSPKPPSASALYPTDNSVTMRSVKGTLVKLSLSRLPEAIQKGYAFMTPGDIAMAINKGEKIEDFTGVGQQPTASPLRHAAESISRVSAAQMGAMTPESLALTGRMPNVKRPEETLAAMGASIPAITMPGAGVVTRMAASTLGGAAGSMLGEPSAPGSAIGRGLEYGAAPEALGAMVTAPLRRIFTGKLGQIPHTAAEWIDKRYTLARTPAGRLIRKEVGKEAKASVERELGIDVPMTQLTGKTKEVISRIGTPLFKDAAADALIEMDLATRGIMVDLGPMKLDVSQRLTAAQRMRNLATKGAAEEEGEVAGSTLNLNPRVAALYNDVLKLPDKVKFMDAFNVRARWRTLAKEPEELIGREPSALFSKSVGEMTDAMDKAVANNLQAQYAWSAFRNMYKEGANVLESQTIAKVMQAHPEKVASAVTDATSARELKEAMLGNAMKWGNIQQQHEASLAWDGFRKAFIQSKLDSGGVFGLSANLRRVGKEALDTIYAGDPAGQQMIKNATAIGDAVARMDLLSDSYGLHAMHAMLTNIPTKILASILRNPTAANMYLRGVTGFMREAQSPSMKWTGEQLYKITPNMARSMAMVARAWILAEEQDSANAAATGISMMERRSTAAPAATPTKPSAAIEWPADKPAE